MTTLCEAAVYIVENAERGKVNELVCKNVLVHAFAMSDKIKNMVQYQTDSYLYRKYIAGGEELPEFTIWAVEWLFDQSEFPKELPNSWDGNPIIDRTVFLPDMMTGLKKAAEEFIADQCGETS